MSRSRPVISNAPSQVAYNTNFTIDIDIPTDLNVSDVKGNLTFPP